MLLKLRLIITSLGVLLGALVPVAPAAAANPRLPDLGMAQITDLQIQKTADGHRLLRFTTRIVNVGVGAFEVHGRRTSTTTSEMTVMQRVFDDVGGYTDVPTTAKMFYAGDGHSHWHMRNLEVYELNRLDNGVKVGTGAKTGFCFFDNVNYASLPGHPPSAVYTPTSNPPACAPGNPSALDAVMGLSIGWADAYYYNLVWQYVDITGLTAGRYRLTTKVNTSLGLQESNSSNDATYVDIQLLGKNGTGFKILGYGPHA